jgi:hypothetical protein
MGARNVWEASSHTVKTELVLLTLVIEARENRTVGVYEIPHESVRGSCKVLNLGI